MSFITSHAIAGRTGWITGVAIAVLAVVAPPSFAQTTVEFTPVRDNTLYEHPMGSLSNGAGEHCFAGMTAIPEARRAVFVFDLSTIPTGSIVLSADFRLVMNRALGFTGPRPMTLHRLATSWGEGMSNANDPVHGGGFGIDAETDDATWLHRFYPSMLWSQPGGDFDAAPLATTIVTDTQGPYQWDSTPELVAVVQAWVNDASMNFGCLLMGDESVNPSARRFLTREATDADSRPRLTITYTTLSASEPPPASTLHFEVPAPNPFNPSTTLRWDAPLAGFVRVSILDARGRLIARPLEGVRPAGPQSFAWQARDARGASLASGVYFVQLEHGGQIRSQRVVLAR